MAVDDQLEFSDPLSDVVHGNHFFGFIHKMILWTQAASGAAGWANIGLCLVSSF